MTEDSYTAWDGNLYEWPPPDGWYLADDKKWWPEGYGPEAGSTSTDPVDVGPLGVGATAGAVTTGPSETVGSADVDPETDSESQRPVYDELPSIDDVFGGADPFADGDGDGDAASAASDLVHSSSDVVDAAMADAELGTDLAQGSVDLIEQEATQEPPGVDAGGADMNGAVADGSATLPIAESGSDFVGAEDGEMAPHQAGLLETAPLAAEQLGASSVGTAPLDPAPSDADSFETQPLDTASFESASFESASFESASFETGSFETGSFGGEDHGVGRDDGDEGFDDGYTVAEGHGDHGDHYDEASAGSLDFHPDANLPAGMDDHYPGEQAPDRVSGDDRQHDHDLADGGSPGFFPPADTDADLIDHPPAFVDPGGNGFPVEAFNDDAHPYDPPNENMTADVGLGGLADDGFRGADHYQGARSSFDGPFAHDDHSREHDGRRDLDGSMAYDDHREHDLHHGHEPPPTRQERVKWPLVAAGVVVAIVIVAAIAVALFRDSGDPSSQDATTTTTAATGPGSVGEPYAFGTGVVVFFDDTVSSQQQRWVIEVLSPVSDGTTQFVDGAGADAPLEPEILAFTRVRVTYQSGPAPGVLGGLFFHAIGSTGTEYTMADNGCSAVLEPFDFDAEVQLEGSIEGNLCWRIPASELGGLKLAVQADSADGTVHLSLS